METLIGFLKVLVYIFALIGFVITVLTIVKYFQNRKTIRELKEARDNADFTTEEGRRTIKAMNKEIDRLMGVKS